MPEDNWSMFPQGMLRATAKNTLLLQRRVIDVLDAAGVPVVKFDIDGNKFSTFEQAGCYVTVNRSQLVSVVVLYGNHPEGDSRRIEHDDLTQQTRAALDSAEFVVDTNKYGDLTVKWPYLFSHFSWREENNE